MQETSAVRLYCAGWSLLFFAVFYLVIDVWKLRRWTLPLVVIGSNSILIYMAQRIIDFDYTTHFFFDGLLSFSGQHKPLLWAIALLTVKWLFLYLMYRRRIFLKDMKKRVLLTSLSCGIPTS